MRELAILFCSSRETSTTTQTEDGRAVFTSNLDNPINTDHAHEELYIALKSLTFTNFFYNSLRKFKLRLGVSYRNFNTHHKTTYVPHYHMNEGSFDVYGFQDQYNSGYILSDEGKTPSTNSLTNEQLGYASIPNADLGVTETPTMPTSFTRMTYNENNRKFTFELDSFNLYFLTAEVTLFNSSPACLPYEYLIEVTQDTEEIYDYLGLFRPGDTNVKQVNGHIYIIIPITTSSTEHHTAGGISYIKYHFPSIKYECPWPVYLRPVDYVDVLCDNIQPTNYSSNSSRLSLAPTLARVPVLSDFGQTQTINIQNLNYLPVQQTHLNSIRIQLTNDDNLIDMQKGCFLCELSVAHEDMPDISTLKGSLNDERHVPALQHQNLFTQDKLDYGQNIRLSSLQEKVLGKNKRSGL